jgi:hypothetical protein
MLFGTGKIAVRMKRKSKKEPLFNQPFRIS